MTDDRHHTLISEFITVHHLHAAGERLLDEGSEDGAMWTGTAEVLGVTLGADGPAYALRLVETSVVFACSIPEVDTRAERVES